MPLFPWEYRTVKPEEIEAVDAVVCGYAEANHFADNIRTTCHDCERAIVHRPYVPKKPVKLCLDCALDRTRGGRA